MFSLRPSAAQPKCRLQLPVCALIASQEYPVCRFTRRCLPLLLHTPQRSGLFGERFAFPRRQRPAAIPGILARSEYETTRRTDGAQTEGAWSLGNASMYHWSPPPASREPLTCRVLLVAAAVTSRFSFPAPLRGTAEQSRGQKGPRLVAQEPDLACRLLGPRRCCIFSSLYYVYDLIALPQFAWIAIPIAATFTLFLWKNRVRSVAGELVGICGLTLTAPLAHYAAVGEIQLLGLWLWALCILYFSSSVFL